MNPNLTYKNRLVSSVILAIAVMALPLILSCGSSSDDTVASGGIGGTGATAGLVSDYGSIFVNGVEFDTSDADIVLEGEWVGSGDQAARSHLPIGQTVVVQGDLLNEMTGTAIQVDAYHRVQGPITQIEIIDSNTRQLAILGQTIFVDQETAISGTTMGDLTSDMVLRVSGVVDGSGAIHAGLIAVQPADSQISLKGTLQHLDLQEQTFMINDQLVDYSQSQPAPDVSALEDQSVSVKGELDNTTLMAQSVSRFDTETFESLNEFSIDGFLQGPIAFNRWQLRPYQVELDPAALFEGVLAEDLTEGIRVQLHGRLRNRILLVNRARATARVWLESTIASVDVDQETIVLEGMNALTIPTNRLTRIRGFASQFSDFQTGDHVRIYAQALDDQSAIASFIFETSAAPLEDRFRIQGPVTHVADPLFEILGVEIDSSANAGIAFFNIEDQPITQNEFIDALSTESTVQAKGQWISGIIVYEEMAIVR